MEIFINIFILDKNIEKSARYHLDKHCVKMILEYSQLLCSALHLNPEIRQDSYNIPYKITHPKHPCSIWTQKSIENFSWLACHLQLLHNEFIFRYKKTHLSYKKMIENNIINNEIINRGMSLNILDLSPALAMPDSCKLECPIESYRLYYNKHKSHLFSYTNRERPKWLVTT